MERLSLSPLRGEDLGQLRDLAGRDQHRLWAPTHLARKGGRIVGVASLLHRMTLANIWLSSTEAGAIDSLCGLTALEALAADAGSQGLVMPCSERSPFYAKMKKLGFETLGLTTVNVKGL